MRSIFVGGLDTNCSADEVKGYFSMIHPVGSVHMPLKRKTGKCKGFAFVDIMVPSSQRFAQLLAGEHLIRGRRVDVEESFCLDEKLDKLKKLQGNKIFIGRMPRTEDLAEIAKGLSKYSEVKSCSFVNTKSKRKSLLVLAELADSEVCVQLSQTGFYYHGQRYAVSLFKQKNVWVGPQEPPTSSLHFNFASQIVKPKLEEYGSSLAHSIERSKLINQSTSNYRFNLVFSLDQYYVKPNKLDYFQDLNTRPQKPSQLCSSTTLSLIHDSLRIPLPEHQRNAPVRGQPAYRGGLTAIENWRVNRAMERKLTVQPLQGTTQCHTVQLFPEPSSFTPASRYCQQKPTNFNSMR